MQKSPNSLRCRVWLSLGLAALLAAGCAGEENDGGILTTGSGGVGAGGSDTGGTGNDDTGGMGGNPSACEEDCSELSPPACYQAVCNEGQHPGPVGSCVIVEADPGTGCDDGLFCTVDDVCVQGECIGGPQNTCGDTPDPCSVVVCDEGTQTCSQAPAENGATCIPESLCEVSGTCQGGECVGAPKDCSFSPLVECHANVACDPASGACVGTPDPTKNGVACSLSGDLCMTGKTCNDGACEGGAPKDCSALTVDCNVGVCNAQTGGCDQMVVPAGGACFDGIDDCHTGTCDASGACLATPVTDGTSCNDFNTCTDTDVCTAGVCMGTSVVGCAVYFEDTFEASCPPVGWTLAQDWECGVPINEGPTGAVSGTQVIATKIAGDYSSGQSYDTSFAQTPPIDLSTATEPMLTFWAYVDTEGGTFDGFNVKVSTNGGASFTQLTAVHPPYALTIDGQPAWGGHLDALGYQRYVVDLNAYAGQVVVVRFAFRSDGSVVNPGVYLDDVRVSDAAYVPITITSPVAIEHLLAGSPNAVYPRKVGGSSNAIWTITAGTNIAWLTIDSMTGVLSGTPSLADIDPASVTVHVQEAGLPSNFDEVTYDFNIVPGFWVSDFEGACPNGWTLTGEWECGTPTSGPLFAYSGAQAIATLLGGNYSNNLTYAGNQATSPVIDLTATVAPQLRFRAYVDTEGNTWDGFNLKISTDGVAFTQVTSVTPVYDLTIDGQPAWGGHLQGLGYQAFTADLSAFAGQPVFVRFDFRSDGSNVNPGVYIDDVLITD